MNKPCASCPFTKEGKRLLKFQAKELAHQAIRDDHGFPCQETTAPDGIGGLEADVFSKPCYGGASFALKYTMVWVRDNRFPDEMQRDTPQVYDTVDEMVDDHGTAR